MAQIVKLEPGDTLILANLGIGDDDWAVSFSAALTQLKEELQLGSILLFEGDVDLSVLPAGWTPDAVAGA
jgi:hypothetical protein